MTDTDKARKAALIRKSPANYDYFFNTLDDPRWLRALTDMGFFQAPPEPEQDGEWIRYPGWPESRYLARIAGTAPSEVLEIAMEVPSTDNARVHQDLLEVAAQLPGEVAARLGRKEIPWLRGHRG